MKKLYGHIPSVILICILLITLPAKFIRGDHIQEVFVLAGSLFGSYGDIFPEIGIYVIAGMESLVILFLLLGIWSKRFKFYGGVLAFLVLVGALFSHLFTPLGINVAGDKGMLFFLAIAGMISSTFIIKKSYKIF